MAMQDLHKVCMGVHSTSVLYCHIRCQFRIRIRCQFCTVPSHYVLFRRIRCQFCTVPSHSALCRRIMYCAVALCTVPSHSVSILYCAVAFCTVPLHSVLCRRILYWSVAFGVNSVLCRRILYCAVAFCTVPLHSVLILYCAVGFCTVPSHSVLCRRILYCAVTCGVNSLHFSTKFVYALCQQQELCWVLCSMQKYSSSWRRVQPHVSWDLFMLSVGTSVKSPSSISVDTSRNKTKTVVVWCMYICLQSWPADHVHSCFPFFFCFLAAPPAKIEWNEAQCWQWINAWFPFKATCSIEYTCMNIGKRSLQHILVDLAFHAFTDFAVADPRRQRARGVTPLKQVISVLGTLWPQLIRPL